MTQRSHQPWQQEPGAEAEAFVAGTSQGDEAFASRWSGSMPAARAAFCMWQRKVAAKLGGLMPASYRT